MKVSKAIKLLQGYPADYNLVITDYTTVIIPDIEDETEQYIIICDDPVTGIVESEDTQEIRFCSERSESILKQEQVDFYQLQ
jgi:hypothetical protein